MGCGETVEVEHASSTAVWWAIFRRPVFEMLGLALHILIDIATHQSIFAVHFLWPLSSSLRYKLFF